LKGGVRGVRGRSPQPLGAYYGLRPKALREPLVPLKIEMIALFDYNDIDIKVYHYNRCKLATKIEVTVKFMVSIPNLC
jgi:hypothetical protein